jgi:hypothetical protein
MPRKLLIAAGVLAPMTIAAAAYGERAWDCRKPALRGDIAAARMPRHPATVRLERFRPDWLRRDRGKLAPEQGVGRGLAKHCFAPAYRFAPAGADAPRKDGDKS